MSSSAKASVTQMDGAVTKLDGKLKGAVGKVKGKFDQGLGDTKGKMDQHAGKIAGKANEAPGKTSGKISEGKAKVNAEASKEPEKKEGGLWGAIKSAASWVAEKLKAAFDFVAKLVTDPGFWVSLVVGIAIAAFVVATFGSGLAVLAVAGVVAGAISGAVGQIVSNVAAGRKWNEGVLQAAAFGAAGGLIFGPVGGRVAGAVGSRVASSAVGTAARTTASRIANSAVAKGASAVARSMSKGMSRLGSGRLGTLLKAGAKLPGKALRNIEEYSAKAGAFARYGGQKLADNVRRRLGVKVPTRTPGEEFFRRSPIRTLRQDNDFRAPVNHKGWKKSHLDDSGDMVPANPAGTTTELQHIRGKHRGPKEDSPYTSVMSDGSFNTPKHYGKHQYTVDLERLARDAAQGKVPGVTVRSPQQIQDDLLAEIQKVAPVSRSQLDDLLAGTAKAEDIAAAAGLGKKATERLEDRLLAYSYNKRDEEWLVAGIIPRDYLVRTGHAQASGAGAAVTSGAGRDDER
jgi:hypothetical protein